MKKIALLLVATASPATAQTTDCIRNGVFTQCTTYPGPVQSDPNALLRALIDSNGRQGDILRQSQQDAQQRRLVQQQIELQRQQIQLQQMQIDAARRAAEAPSYAPPPIDRAPLSAKPYPAPTTPQLAQEVLERHIAEGDCPAARQFAFDHGDPHLIARVTIACPVRYGSK